MALDALLIDLLVCPVDHEPLWYFDDESILYNPRTHVIYAVNDGIPVLLPDEGRPASAEDQERLEAKKAGATVTGPK